MAGKPRAPRRPAAVKAQAARTPNPPAVARGPDFYIADVYHEIQNGDGVKRVEPGFAVVTVGDGVDVMPPARFAEAYPELAG